MFTVTVKANSLYVQKLLNKPDTDSAVCCLYF